MLTKTLLNKYRVKILLLITSCAVSLILAEFTVRYFKLTNLLHKESITWDHWELLKPNAQKYEHDEDIGIVKKNYKISPKKTDEFRIIVMGDSISDFAAYVKELSQLIERKSSGKKITIINTGTIGYNTVMQLNFLKKYRKKLQADILIHQFCLNDFGYTPVIVKKNDSFIPYNLGPLDFIPQKFINQSELLKLFATVVAHSFNVFKEKTGIHYITEQQDKQVKNALMEIVKIAEEEKSSYRLVLIPYFTQEEFRSRLQSRIYSIVNDLSLGNEVIDTIPMFDEEKITEFQQQPGDYTHPNLVGSRIIANKIFENIVGLLPH